MSIQLIRALEKLKIMLRELADHTEEQVRKAITAFQNRDQIAAGQVIAFDEEIDSMEIDLEEECLKILSLYQPVALDLRFVVSVLKINNDLERIGDLAGSIAERAKSLPQQGLPKVNMEYESMAENVLSMLRDAIHAFMESNPELARSVCSRDVAVNKVHRENYKVVADAVSRNPQSAAQIISLLSVSRYLERIGDLATNIAEDAVYMVEGQIIRHSVKI